MKKLPEIKTRIASFLVALEPPVISRKTASGIIKSDMTIKNEEKRMYELPVRVISVGSEWAHFVSPGEYVYLDAFAKDTITKTRLNRVPVVLVPGANIAGVAENTKEIEEELDKIEKDINEEVLTSIKDSSGAIDLQKLVN